MSVGLLSDTFFDLEKSIECYFIYGQFSIKKINENVWIFKEFYSGKIVFYSVN